MVLEEIKSIKSEKKDLRKFGITMCVAIGLLGGLVLWRGGDYYSYFFMLSGLFLFFVPGSLPHLRSTSHY